MENRDTHIILVRHGETAWNVEDRCIGISDIGLNDRGLVQAQQLAEVLKNAPINHIYSSDLRRALETAAAIRVYHSATLKVDPALREVSYGIWEGKPVGALWTDDLQNLQSWFEDPACPPPGGESYVQLEKRISPLVERLLADYAGETILLVGHNGSLQMVLFKLLKMPIQAGWPIRFENASWSLVTINRYNNFRPYLTILNSTHAFRHLG